MKEEHSIPRRAFDHPSRRMSVLTSGGTTLIAPTKALQPQEGLNGRDEEEEGGDGPKDKGCEKVSECIRPVPTLAPADTSVRGDMVGRCQWPATAARS